MIARFAVPFLLVAVPAFGQSRVYTNADLGKVQRTHNAPESELAWLRAHQFVAVPDRPAGPEVIVVAGSTAEGPFGPFYTTPSLPLALPLESTVPLGSFYGGFYGRHAGRISSVVPNLSAPAPITVPPFARGSSPAAPHARRR